MRSHGHSDKRLGLKPYTLNPSAEQRVGGSRYYVSVQTRYLYLMVGPARVKPEAGDQPNANTPRTVRSAQWEGYIIQV